MVFVATLEHQQDHQLMPVIIQRFAELGAVIESQKRHIDRWKGKELDLAIEEAQQNLELIRELGEVSSRPCRREGGLLGSLLWLL